MGCRLQRSVHSGVIDIFAPRSQWLDKNTETVKMLVVEVEKESLQDKVGLYVKERSRE